MGYLKSSRIYRKNTRIQSKRYGGFDYRKVIIQKNVSSYLLNNEIINDTFVEDLNEVINHNLNAIKDLKKFYGYSINKFDYDIN